MAYQGILLHGAIWSHEVVPLNTGRKSLTHLSEVNTD